MKIWPRHIALLLATLMVPTAAAHGQSNWVVWKLDTTYPAQVGAAPAGNVTPPSYEYSAWNSDAAGAWKKVCWLVRNGDIQGRRYVSPEISNGHVVCDPSCNCVF